MLKVVLKKVLANAGKSIYDEDKFFVTYKTKRDDIKDLFKRLRPKGVLNGLIRLGPKGDGGYLIPDDLLGITHLFSPGVCGVSGFELSCAESGIKVYMADKSVDRPPAEHLNFSFIRKHIGVTRSENVICMNEWVRESLAGEDEVNDLLLQMDIEGAEYAVILSMDPEILRMFRVIVIEFHSLDQLWNRQFFEVARQAFDKICKDHDCVHIHPNNCCGVSTVEDIAIPVVAELTFYRKDRLFTGKYVDKLTHDDDYPNTDQEPIWLDPGLFEA